MKKVFLIASFGLFVCLVLMGCSKKYTFKQYTDDMGSIRDDDSGAIWNEAQDDESADHATILGKIIQNIEDIISKAKDIEKKITDSEMKTAHAAYVKGFELRRDGFKKILEGINNQDYDTTAEGQQMLQESAAPRGEWFKYIEKMATAMDK